MADIVSKTDLTTPLQDDLLSDVVGIRGIKKNIVNIQNKLAETKVTADSLVASMDAGSKDAGRIAELEKYQAYIDAMLAV